MTPTTRAAQRRRPGRGADGEVAAGSGVVAGLRGLAAGLDGVLVLPGEAAFADTRRRRTRFLDRSQPVAVVRCASTADVTLAVRFAGEHGLPLALRGGGHSLADRSDTDGLLVDLGPMDAVAVSGGTVTIGPGVRVGALSARLAPLGLVVPSGWCPMVGVTGAALGGGFGPYGRLFGPACDHVISAEVVLATGQVVHASTREHPDLLWALRGAGGGQFGVVTELRLWARQVPPTTVFALTWRYEHAAAVVHAWQEHALTAPDRVNAELVLAMGPDPGTIPLVVLFGIVVGENAPDADAWLDAVARTVGEPPWRRSVTAMSGQQAAAHHTYAGAPASTEPVTGVPDGERPGHRVLRSHFLAAPLPSAAVDALVESVVADRVAGQYREVELVPWRGAYSHPVDAAFAHREPLFLVEHNADVGATATDDERAAVDAWVARSWDTVRPWATGAVYPNYPDPDLPDPLTAYHGAHLGRLIEVKAAYDPHDVFRHAQSVPAGVNATGCPVAPPAPRPGPAGAPPGR